MWTIAGTYRPLDKNDIDEFDKMLSIPLNFLVLRVLDLEHYSELLNFLPWDNRFQVAVLMLTVVQDSGKVITDVRQIEYLFIIVTLLNRNTETKISVIDGDVGAVH